MKSYRGILIIGTIEILIGTVTLLGTFISIILDINAKTPNVLFFVIITAALSTLIGIGILQTKKEAFWLLLYFSSVILLSKILILMGIIHLNGALATVIPPQFKDLISMFYHGIVIVYLNKKEIKAIFHS